MNKLIQLSILACGAYASTETEIDSEELSKKVMEKVSEQVLEMNLKPLIDAEVSKRVIELLAQKEEDDSNKFKQFTGEDWIQYDQLLLHQKLSNVLDDLEKDTVIDSMFKDASKESRKAALRKFLISFDLEKGDITISTKAKDADGKPLFDWKFDKQQGEITHIQRVPILNPSKIVEQARLAERGQNIETNPEIPVEEIQPVSQPVFNTPKAAVGEVQVETIGKIEEDEDFIPQEKNQELQEALAFKIVYCFALFVIGSFGLLYSFFKVDQKDLKQKYESKGQKAIGYTFADFLAGNQQYIVDDEKQNIILKDQEHSQISRRNSVQTTEHEF